MQTPVIRLCTHLMVLACVLLAAACSPKINIVRDHAEPLEEYVLEGEGRDKILLVQVRGIISTSPQSGLLAEEPSLVQEVTARLRKAAKDEQVKAVVLAIDSPGGSVTASDILYQEITRYKRDSGAPAVALLMGLAASGGYYAAAGADRIIAHPTTVTGSIGTVFIRPDLAGLMEKIGVEAEVTKSGKYKDISSWFRNSTEEERRILQQMIDQLNSRFLETVRTSRGLDEAQMALVGDARVFTAQQALEVGLVDATGYAQDALDQARSLAGVAADATVVTYRRSEFADDTAYNTLSTSMGAPALPGASVMDKAGSMLQALSPGFHYLWLPGSSM